MNYSEKEMERIKNDKEITEGRSILVGCLLGASIALLLLMGFGIIKVF